MAGGGAKSEAEVRGALDARSGRCDLGGDCRHGVPVRAIGGRARRVRGPGRRRGRHRAQARREVIRAGRRPVPHSALVLLEAAALIVRREARIPTGCAAHVASAGGDDSAVRLDRQRMGNIVGGTGCYGGGDPKTPKPL